MKKIMFSDEFLLTQAVLEGRKTQTRRVITYPKTFHKKDVCGYYVCRRATDRAITEVCMYDENESFIDEGQILPKYKVGEVVAVAQSYADCGNFPDCEYDEDGYPIIPTRSGFFNKMFVRADLMPHQILITDVRVERLQDISDEDCLKEGVRKVVNENGIYIQYYVGQGNNACSFENPREAFAHLINKVSRKDVWSDNPYVFVYDFELIK